MVGGEGQNHVPFRQWQGWMTFFDTFCVGRTTIIDHPFGNGLYQLSMVMTGGCCYTPINRDFTNSWIYI